MTEILAVKLLEYGRTELLLSDHKPVSRYLNARLKVINRVKEREVYERVNRNSTNGERSNSQGLFSTSMRSFSIKFTLISITKRLVVENIGQVVALQFSKDQDQ